MKKTIQGLPSHAVLMRLITFPIFLITNLLFGQTDSLPLREMLNNTGKSETVFLEVPFEFNSNQEIEGLEIPWLDSTGMISHGGYSFCYSEAHEQSKWVAYQLSASSVKGTAVRSDRFLADPKVKTGTAVNEDYAGSGYDKGHLAPAADMRGNEIAMGESFYFSNISPQSPKFNRGIWKRLETMVRSWAVENSELYIVTGPILSPGLPVIGENQVSVPNYFYKVILDYQSPQIKGIGFLMPCSALTEPIQNFAVSIDSVERFTGLNFFHLLPDDQEMVIEQSICMPCWNWDAPIVDNSKIKQTTEGEVPFCQARTKKGKPCKNKVQGPTGFCAVHQKK